MKSKLTWVLFIPLLLLAGFFKLGQELLPQGAIFGLSNLQLEYCYMAAVALIFLFALLFCLIDKKISAYYLPHRNFPAGIIGLVLALLLGVDGANTLLHIFSSGKIDILNTIEAFLALLCAVVFIILGLNHSFRNKESKRLGLIYALVSLLCAIRMILCFVQFTTVSIRLADVSSLICYVFVTLFFFYYAEVLSLVKTKNAVKLCFIFGFPATIALIPYGVYRLWLKLDTQDIFSNLRPAEMLLFGLYVLAFLIELTAFVRTKDSVIAEEKGSEDTSDEKLEDLFATAETEDENDRTDDTSYVETDEAEGFLYQVTAPAENNLEGNNDTNNDVDGYLTEVIEEEDDDEYADIDAGDIRPKDYMERLDEIDKLILDITSQSD